MDRSWRDTSENILLSDNLTGWEKFKSGGYTFRNISDNQYKKIIRKQKLCDYLASEFENINTLEDEQDLLLLKQA